LPVARYVEFLTPAPYIENILVEPFQLDSRGYLKIPEKPGLGIEIDRDALARYA
jgi:D-galactarolactone cycloisomerase